MATAIRSRSTRTGLIGATRETLAHTIGDFRRQGILTIDHQRVAIQNAERLLEVAEGDDG